MKNQWTDRDLAWAYSVGVFVGAAVVWWLT